MEKIKERIGDNVCEVSIEPETIVIDGYREVNYQGGIGYRRFGSPNAIKKENLFFSTNVGVKKEGDKIVLFPLEGMGEKEIMYERLEIYFGCEDLWITPVFSAEGKIEKRITPWNGEATEEDPVIINLPSPVGDVVMKAGTLPDGTGNKIRFTGLKVAGKKQTVGEPGIERGHLRWSKRYVYYVEGKYETAVRR